MSLEQLLAHEAYDFETITVSTTAVGLTGAKVQPSDAAPAKAAYMTVAGADIRYRYDGTDPTASVGHLLKDGNAIRLAGVNNLRNFNAIRDAAVDATLTVTFER